ncbi:hypothetical protein E2C01_090150 [Portunus trituberculatus]|uniref:Uncharacterized protein n=1 Tax=Portunus trituberculatus TaxID=210409 RepID=A0A5B7JPE1_PORTR|nr:hypothetical protein [Portunus trituberculatus]
MLPYVWECSGGVSGIFNIFQIFRYHGHWTVPLRSFLRAAVFCCRLPRLSGPLTVSQRILTRRWLLWLTSALIKVCRRRTTSGVQPTDPGRLEDGRKESRLPTEGSKC